MTHDPREYPCNIPKVLQYPQSAAISRKCYNSKDTNFMICLAYTENSILVVIIITTTARSITFLIVIWSKHIR